MAAIEAIRTLVAEAAGVAAKRVTDEDQEAAVTLLARNFKGTSSEKLTAAFDSWLASYGERPPQALPTPAQLWVHHNATARRGDHAVASTSFQPPSQAFMQKFREVNERAGLLGSAHRIGRSVDERVDVRHVHEDRHNGELGRWAGDEWRRCPACTRIEKRRERVAEVLADLPEAVPESPRSCVCGGSGMVDTAASLAALEVTGWAHREVYPCKRCNADEFYRWCGTEEAS